MILKCPVDSLTQVLLLKRGVTLIHDALVKVPPAATFNGGIELGNVLERWCLTFSK